jgi:hypothetical protein
MRSNGELRSGSLHLFVIALILLRSPRCKYRLWRSEIECYGAGSASGNPGSQVLRREVCACSAECRPVDPYDSKAFLNNVL